MDSIWDIDIALERLRQQHLKPIGEYSESDTRSKLIDKMLYNLGWDEDDIKREERCVESNTFLDYKLTTTTPCFIIEAKSTAVHFEFPVAQNKQYYKIGGVLSNCKVLKNAMIQARDYANSKGILFCAVTNGTSYVFFRSGNQQGIDWADQTALIFRDETEIEKHFKLFCQSLAKASIESGDMIDSIPVKYGLSNTSANYQKLNLEHLSTVRNKERNPLFPFIGEIVHRVFQDLASKSAESEILEHCYVDSPKKADRRNPYIDISSTPLTVSKKDAGDFQRKITTSLKAGKIAHKEIILLLGSVGVGKSTFIQRFRKVLAKKDIDENGIWIYVNFKHFSDTGDNLDEFVFGQISTILSEDYAHLEVDNWSFLKQVYHSEYNKLKSGVLAPLYKKSPEEFELKFSEKVELWIEQSPASHTTRQLKTASNRFNRSVFLVFDNADQLNPKTQNDIFLIAEKLTTDIECYALLSMREESYWKTRDSGPLNAFHTTAYRVQPATFEQVLSKRFKYARNLIENKDFADQMFDTKDSGIEVTSEDLIRVFDRLVKTLLGSDKRYIKYIESMAARDTRRALDTVAAFMVSGHTNLAAIIRDERKPQPKGFPIPFHEFLNAIILRDLETYSEGRCDVINMFNTSGGADSSNFSRLIVLGKILHSKSATNYLGTGFVAIENVIADCNTLGVPPEVTSSILSTFNSKRIIETEKSIKDEETSSSHVRATSSGIYYIEELLKDFSYLEVVLLDTPIRDNKSYKKMKKLHKELDSIGTTKALDRLNRVKKRLELTEEFLNYLFNEYNSTAIRNRKDIIAPEVVNLVQNIRINFNKDRKIVVKNAEVAFGFKSARAER
ncbi:P-loop NTPase fold protein [Vibrio harveyi]|uniref:P-loop NTPase fold protein n=1 Tax=Vibrio harveyi TaxID=669 RepID=UPI003CED3A72